MFSCFSFKCCGTRDPLESANNESLIWSCGKSNTKIKESLICFFEKSEIRFLGLFDEELKNKPIDLDLIN